MELESAKTYDLRDSRSQNGEKYRSHSWRKRSDAHSPSQNIDSEIHLWQMKQLFIDLERGGQCRYIFYI